MDNAVTWVVLCDGTYVKILVNNGQGTGLMPLRTGDFEHSSDLTYAMVTSQSQIRKNLRYYDLLAEFLSQQHKENNYQSLMVIAPAQVLQELKTALPTQVNDLITREFAEDLLAKPDNHIEQRIYPQAGVGPR